MLCPPAAATSKARLTCPWPRTSPRSGVPSPSLGATHSASTLKRLRRSSPLRCEMTSDSRLAPNTSTPSTTAASGAFSTGRMRPLIPPALHASATERAPLTGLRAPSKPSSPTTAIPSSPSWGISPAPARSPSAKGRSKALPSFRMSAGARLTVIFRRGMEYPEFWIAAQTRSRPSRTAPSANPTTAKEGSPLPRFTSTWTR